MPKLFFLSSSARASPMVASWRRTWRCARRRAARGARPRTPSAPAGGSRDRGGGALTSAVRRLPEPGTGGHHEATAAPTPRTTRTPTPSPPTTTPTRTRPHRPSARERRGGPGAPRRPPAVVAAEAPAAPVLTWPSANPPRSPRLVTRVRRGGEPGWLGAPPSAAWLPARRAPAQRTRRSRRRGSLPARLLASLSPEYPAGARAGASRPTSCPRDSSSASRRQSGRRASCAATGTASTTPPFARSGARASRAARQGRPGRARAHEVDVSISASSSPRAARASPRRYEQTAERSGLGVGTCPGRIEGSPC